MQGVICHMRIIIWKFDSDDHTALNISWQFYQGYQRSFDLEEYRFGRPLLRL